MGTFRYPIALYSQDGAQSHRVEALVDTGATYTWVPRPLLEQLGHRPAFRQRLRLANGTVIERDGSEVVVELDGARRTTVVIFGDAKSEALLGAVTLEQFSLAPDPVARRLVPVEALLMRAGVFARGPALVLPQIKSPQLRLSTCPPLPNTIK